MLFDFCSLLGILAFLAVQIRIPGATGPLDHSSFFCYYCLLMATTSAPKEVIQLVERQIAATDRQIDDLVYNLYGLSKDEIRIVEGADTAGRCKP